MNGRASSHRSTLVCLKAAWLLGMAFLLLLWNPQPAVAQTGSPAAKNLPSASRLQQAHDIGRQLARRDFEAEQLGSAPPPRDNLEYRLDSYLKKEGAGLSATEREVFTEAYWNSVDDQLSNFGGGITRINPPTPPNASPTTTVSGKTTTPGTGTLQLTDREGRSFFVDVDSNGAYSLTVPVSNFQPVKMTLRTETLKAAWTLNQQGKWIQVSSASSPATAGTAGYALLDECNRAVLLASQDATERASRNLSVSQPTASSPLRLVRLFGRQGGPSSQRESPIHLVNDPLPPDAVREAQKQGINHADQQFEKMELEKIPKGSRTPAQNERLDKLNDMLKDYDNAKKSPLANQDVIAIAEKAAQARWLQRQAQALRATGTPGSEQAAQALDSQAKQLLGGQDPPPLRASAEEPLQFSSAPGTARPGTRLVAAGQSGYAMVSSAATSTGQGIKGHSRLVATGEIKQQTTTELELESLAHLEEEPSATSTFAQYLGYDFKNGAWANPNLSLGVQWSDADAKPPRVDTVGQDGSFQFSDFTVSPKICYRLNYAVEFNHVSTPISPTYGDAYELTVNGNPSWIAAFKTPRIADKFFGEAAEKGAVSESRYSWTGFYTGTNEAPFMAAGQISDEGYNTLAWNPDFRDFMVWGERNPGVLPQPVPGLNPEDWPHTEGEAIPSLSLDLEE